MTPILNHYSYFGSCAPSNGLLWHSDTFSVGIFKWVPTKNGKGLKKSKVVYRIYGYTSRSDTVFDRAEALCAELNAGGSLPAKKSEWV